jgi:hypothetical protein
VRRFFAVSAALAFLLELSACGGGGGGGGSSLNDSLTFALSTNTINFQAAGVDQTPSQVTLTGRVTGPVGNISGTLYVLIYVGNPSIATAEGFSVVGSSGFTTIVPASATALGPGSFTETITVKACLNDPTCASSQLQGSPQTVTVNYTIPGVASTASALSYSIGNAPTSASFNNTFQVSGYPAQSWTATSSIPWLTLTPSSGSTASAVSVSGALDQTRVNAFDGGTYTGTVTLTPSNGSPITIPVSLTVARTQVNYVAPYVAIAGTTGNVIIRGEHFSLITPTGVNFGTTAATSFSVVSDTEIHATYPVLQAGSYTVHLVSSQGVDRTNAQLNVVNPITFTAGVLQYPTTIGTPSAPQNLLYDAPRQTMLLNFGNGIGVRYAYSSGWGAPATVALPMSSSIIESVDGTAIIAASLDPTSNELTVAQLDPVTLATVKTVSAPTALGPQTMAVSNNGHILIDTRDPGSADDWPLYDYAPLNGSLTGLGGTPLPAPHNVAASLDGSALLIQTWNGLNDTSTEKYDSNQDTIASAPVQLSASEVKINRDGSRIMAFDSGSGQITVYDSGLNLLGALPLQSGPSTITFGPISGHVYAYDNTTVRIFDLSQPAVAGVFPEILPALTHVQNGDTEYLAITPDEAALFGVGSQGVVVVPLH